MTAQIRPNRMEVSDRFPMLGFAVHSDEADINAEVVLTTDIGLFQQQNRTRRTAANFYSSREHGMLQVPRGEGVFVVPPEVLARFIGNDRLYFGLATGKRSNGGLHVDAVPRDGSPYVSLRSFTGRTLRRSMGGDRRSAPPVLDWTGDAAQPGSQPAPNGNGSNAAKSNGSSATNPSTSAAPAASAQGVQYDDLFGPIPDLPARNTRNIRQANVRPSNGKQYGLSMGSGLTAQKALDWIKARVEDVVGAAGSDVDPPTLYRLGDNSSTFRTAWKTVNKGLGLFSPVYSFFGDLPDLADSSGVTLSIGPALDTPVFGAGVGVVFEPGGQVALFGQADISIDVEGVTDFLKSLKAALAAKMKLGYNRDGIAGFASLAKVASLEVGEEVVVGAEIWLDSSGQGLGGAVSIGGGFALELAADTARAKLPARNIRQANVRPNGKQYGLSMGSGLTAQEALDWIKARVEDVVGAVGSDVDPPTLYRLGDNSSAFRSAWTKINNTLGYLSGIHAFLGQLPALADSSGVTLSIGPALDTPVFGAGVGVVFEPGGQVALFGQADISVDIGGITDFLKSLKASLQAKMKLGYNHGGIDGFASLAKVASVAAGEEIVVGAEIWLDSSGQGLGGAVSIGGGFALELAAEPAPSYVPPVLPSDPRERAKRIGGAFPERIGQALDLGLQPQSIDPLLSILEPQRAPIPMGYARANADCDDDDQILQPPAPQPRARAMGGGADAAIAIGTFILETIRDSHGDVSWELDQFRGIKHPNDQAPANPGPFRDGATVNLDDWPVSGGLVDDISAWFKIDWQYNGQSLGNVRIVNIGTNDAAGWGLSVRAQIMDDNKVYPPNNCAALRLTFHYRFDRSIGSDVIAIRNVTLYGNGTWESDGNWVQSSTFAAAKGASRKRAAQRKQGQGAYA